MAPGVGGLPAAEREVEVAGPVAEFMRSLSPKMLAQLRLGLRAFEWLPFPRRFSRLDAAGARALPARLERSRWGLKHELLLMAKVFSTLGYAVTPRVRGRSGSRRAAGWPTAPCPSRPARSATRRRRPAARNATW